MNLLLWLLPVVFWVIIPIHLLWAVEEEHVLNSSKTVIDLQPYRHSDSIRLKGPDGIIARITLINLNPRINVWYLLGISRPEDAQDTFYHLENAYPDRYSLLLDAANPGALVIAEEENRYTYDVWETDSRIRSAKTAQKTRAYLPLFGGRFYLRNPVKGHRTKIEVVTEFLRDDVRGGEKIVTFVRDRFFKDAYRDTAKVVGSSIECRGNDISPGEPEPAIINPKYTGRTVIPTNLGLQVEDTSPGGLCLGRWYAAKDNPGIHVSLIQPSVIAEQILQSHPGAVNPLDSIEATSLVYLVAFDLAQFDLGFALGTEHPRVGWADNMLEQMRDPVLPGPDGIDATAPLVSSGLVNPIFAAQMAATFTGGFKRTHGAFKYGELSLKNHGSHYGFIVNGVVFSKLQPELSTLFVLDDGTVEMKTWKVTDNGKLPGIKHARQNGVPIIEFNTSIQLPVPGRLVKNWGAGNWSGSADKKLRTLRAGVGMQEGQGGRFLIYALFSSATPSAMARVFQAYGVQYAMLTDMNALEHTYMAVYSRQGSNLLIQHLLHGMSEVDRSIGGQYVPRFIGYADNRDFFYLVRRSIMVKQTP